MKTAAQKLASLDRMFRAFADPTRLRILYLLTGGERCVCDLVSAINVPQPKISRHLAYLRAAKLVSVRRQGLWMYYKLAPGRDAAHKKLLECLGCCFGEIPEFQKDCARLSVTLKKRGCC
jgi:ArsR family transcriptional regulator, arsenate/arsenite/antimonite-responsive transcriptional repressor